METSAQMCETFDQELAGLKEEIRAVVGEQAFHLLVIQLDSNDSDRYRHVSEGLVAILQGKSVIHLRDIDAHWPSLGSQKFIDKMQEVIDNYNLLRAVVTKWDIFMRRYDGVLDEIVRKHRRQQQALST